MLAKTNRLRRSRLLEAEKFVLPDVVALKSCHASRVESCVLNFNESCRQTGAAKVARETETCRFGKLPRFAHSKFGVEIYKYLASVGVAAKVVG